MRTPGAFKDQSQEGLELVWSSAMVMTRILSTKVRGQRVIVTNTQMSLLCA